MTFHPFNAAEAPGPVMIGEHPIHLGINNNEPRRRDGSKDENAARRKVERKKKGSMSMKSHNCAAGNFNQLEPRS